MKLMHFICSAGLSLVTLSVGAQAIERSWSDAQTGREYILLDGAMTWNQADRTCNQRGYALFDVRHVTSDEQKSFLASDLMTHFGWTSFFPGTSQEMQVATVWQSAEEMIIAAGSDFGARVMMVQKKRGQTSMAAEWRTEDQDTAGAVCMSVPGFWYRCSMEVKCTYDRGAHEYSWRYKLADFGSSEGEAMRMIIQRTQEAPFSISEGACVAQTESSYCLRTLPARQ